MARTFSYQKEMKTAGLINLWPLKMNNLCLGPRWKILHLPMYNSSMHLAMAQLIKVMLKPLCILFRAHIPSPILPTNLQALCHPKLRNNTFWFPQSGICDPCRHPVYYCLPPRKRSVYFQSVSCLSTNPHSMPLSPIPCA